VGESVGSASDRLRANDVQGCDDCFCVRVELCLGMRASVERVHGPLRRYGNDQPTPEQPDDRRDYEVVDTTSG
jgi:hypothetical protein